MVFAETTAFLNHSKSQEEAKIRKRRENKGPKASFYNGLNMMLEPDLSRIFSMNIMQNLQQIKLFYNSLIEINEINVHF